MIEDLGRHASQQPWSPSSSRRTTRVMRRSPCGRRRMPPPEPVEQVRHGGDVPPPRRVSMPRALSSPAIARRLVAPPARMSATTGARSWACRSALRAMAARRPRPRRPPPGAPLRVADATPRLRATGQRLPGPPGDRLAPACATSAMIPTERLCSGAGGAHDQQLAEGSPKPAAKEDGAPWPAGRSYRCLQGTCGPPLHPSSFPAAQRPAQAKNPQQRPTGLI